ncbi:esterase-like activity of phytase family protein [Novosphingobium sp.]|uniref:esterase-like activity of phytase family protein n=1 Tax=Novosphingobium sp. TaxID=1874826 RepID=UPI0035ADE239
MNRRMLIVLLVFGLAPGTWLRSAVPSPDLSNGLDLAPVALGPGCCRAGPLRLEQAWQLTSPNVQFGGYSALLRVTPGRLLTFSDRGYFLDLAEPGAASGAARFGSTLPGSGAVKTNRDIEAATWDPATGQLWLAQEGQNAVARYGPGMRLEVRRRVPEWQDWASNSGVEAFVRLRDGRFIALCECRDGWFGEFRHPATIHSGDPTDARPAEAFTFAGVDGYRPTDMAQLPDGRALILMRRLLWPVPARFAIKVALADPAEIRPGQVWRATEIAELSAPWPVDNYEGLAIERQLDGKLIAWIISDENGAVSQRVLLLKVRIDEAALPPR